MRRFTPRALFWSCASASHTLTVAVRGATVQDETVKRHTTASCFATYLLPHVVGEAHARDLLLTGRVVDADEALRLGLVSRVIAPDAFRDEVLARLLDLNRARAAAERALGLSPGSVLDDEIEDAAD